MNEDANDIFKSLMAKANRNLISECAELRAKLQAAEARVKELEADNARGAAYVQHLKEQLSALQQGGAK